MFLIVCGDKRVRTADICRARTALYQLSYIPFFACASRDIITKYINVERVGYSGFEPPALPLSGVCSNQLS